MAEDGGNAFWAKEMDAFIGYVAKFDDTFPGKLVGASVDDLQRLEALARLPIPPEYRAFLLRMGRTPAGRLGKLFAKTEVGVEAVEQYYNEPTGPVPRDAIYLLTIESVTELFVKLGGAPAAHRPVLFFSRPVDEETGEFLETDRVDHVHASCLMQLLYRDAFRWIRKNKVEFHLELRETMANKKKPDEARRSQMKDRYREIIAKLGFAPVPYVDGDQLYDNRQDAYAMFYSEEIAFDHIYLGAADERELVRMGEILSDSLGFYSV